MPLSKALGRMKKALFQPFDLNIWLRLGFTAWLAGLTDFRGGGGSGSGKGKPDWDDFFEFPDVAWNWLQSHPLWFNLIIIGVVLLIILLTVIIWVSSRGKFMFLHNVAKGKNDVSYAWSEYKKEGNSLFLWRFFFRWLACAIIILVLVYAFYASKEMYYGGFPDVLIFWRIAGIILLFFTCVVIIGYVSLFLNDFAVPLMYGQRIGIIQAWMKFLPLFGRHFFTFVIYGLFVTGLHIAVAIVVLFLCLITCCIGLLLLAIPFIGSVMLLPVSYTFRAYSIEFLAQFGDEFNVFPVTELQAEKGL
jgi:hypothetical protein